MVSSILTTKTGPSPPARPLIAFSGPLLRNGIEVSFARCGAKSERETTVTAIAAAIIDTARLKNVGFKFVCDW